MARRKGYAAAVASRHVSITDGNVGPIPLPVWHQVEPWDAPTNKASVRSGTPAAMHRPRSQESGATITAENGATDRQLMAMFDWSAAARANACTEAARRKRLAGDGMLRLESKA